MSDEKQNEFSFSKNEDRTLPGGDAPVNAPQDEPTRQFTVPPAEDAQITIKSAPKTKPTETFRDVKTKPTKILTGIEKEPADKSVFDENALRPSRLRFAVVCLLFVNMFVFAGINTFQTFSIQSFPPYVDTPQGDTFVIVNVRPGFEGAFQIGDEIVSLDGIEVKPANIKRLDGLAIEKPGAHRTVIVRRGGEVRQIETVSVPVPLGFRLNRILYDLLLRAIFLTTGLLIFLFKPNDKQAFLLTLIFLSALASESLSVLLDLPPVLSVVKAFGLLIIMFCAPLFLHFCLVFPSECGWDWQQYSIRLPKSAKSKTIAARFWQVDIADRAE